METKEETDWHWRDSIMGPWCQLANIPVSNSGAFGSNPNGPAIFNHILTRVMPAIQGACDEKRNCL